MLAAPEQFTVEHEDRHSENALFLGGKADIGQLATARLGEILGKSRAVGPSLPRAAQRSCTWARSAITFASCSFDQEKTTSSEL